MKTDLIKAGGIIFAPMEGVTDPIYRETVTEVCPGWDVLACDFLRVPNAGHYPKKHLIKHLGERFYNDPDWNARTMFQILTSPNAYTVEMVKQIQEVGIKWIDLNLGCPSNTVCKNGGGSFLLKDLFTLERIVSSIRKNFNGRFTCKVRVGWADGGQFSDTIKLLNDAGAEMITVHGRTREMMYKEPARWHWIEEAVKVSQVPIVGNGDVWSALDAKRMLKDTGCYAVMVARGALKTPWFPMHYYEGVQETPDVRLMMAQKFLSVYAEKMLASGVHEKGLVKQLKSVTRFIFDELPEGEALRRKVLLSQSTSNIFNEINGASLC
ncbi:MAG: tRNA-dihydrouridine synthase family protein [Bacteriovoracaceae bacterium]|nr:tRNA-dihydrouridine synthase family protein [Bacteriovoracaceae bacterium]